MVDIKINTEFGNNPTNNNTGNSINTGYSPFFVRFKKESKIIKYTYTKQHKHSNPVPVQLYNYYFLYKVIYNPTILFTPTNPNSDYALMYDGLASTITGGNFLEGAAIGLVVTALNHGLHEALDPDPTQQQKGNEKKLEEQIKEKQKYDVDKAVEHLENNANEKSISKCARFVRKAIDAGGINTNNRGTNSDLAKNYDVNLEKWGFENVEIRDLKSYNPFKGEAIIQNYPGGSLQVILQMFSGKQWISDFKQQDFWPGSGYKNNTPSFKIYRYKNY